MRRVFALFSATTVLAAGLLAVGATSASAADLPPDELLYVIGDEVLYTSTADGVLTQVAPLTDIDSVYGADWDPTTGLAYFFNDGLLCDLYSLDVTTGVATLVGPLEFGNCDALDVAADGTLRVGSDNGVIYTIDKTNGSTISDITVSIELSFLAQAPSGVFYVGDYAGVLYTLDTSTGDTVEVATPNDYTESADFDRAGTLWMSVNGDECQGLGSLSLADPEGSYVVEGDFLDGGSCISGYALFLAPAPALPATGSAAPTAGVVLAGLALLLGAGAI